MTDAGQIAKSLHDARERLVPDYGYGTRKASAKPWSEAAEISFELLNAAVQSLLNDDTLSPRAPRPYAVRRQDLQGTRRETGKPLDPSTSPCLGGTE